MGFKLTEEQAFAFLKYKDMLAYYNAQFNLTAITDEKEIILKHFVDSCMGAKIIGNVCGMAIPISNEMHNHHINNFPKTNGVLCNLQQSNSFENTPFLNGFDCSCKIVDIGAGAGFPGIPLSIVLPASNFALVDSLRKRTIFLQKVKEQLQLNNIEIAHTRSEDFGHEQERRESFDVAVSRAVAPLHRLTELCLPLVAVGGIFIAYKGNVKSTEEEVEKAERAIALIGGKVEDIVYYKLPATDIIHSIVIINKITQTSETYPRKPKKIKNSPIL